MKKEFDNFTIEYTIDDFSYIDDLLKHFLLYQDKIMNFFHMERLDRKVDIKTWNDVRAYEGFIKSEIKRIFNVSIEMNDWEVGELLLLKMKVRYIFYLIKREENVKDIIKIH